MDRGEEDVFRAQEQQISDLTQRLAHAEMKLQHLEQFIQDRFPDRGEHHIPPPMETDGEG